MEAGTRAGTEGEWIEWRLLGCLVVLDWHPVFEKYIACVVYVCVCVEQIEKEENVRDALIH